ncbi:DUF502 domain-containing protein [Salibacteraceae bacterium]|nr:DUF502 domain-containing protein [Salibacteraceae bacterium]
MSKLFSFIAKYFVRGLIFLVPVAATVYVIFQAFIYIDGIIPYEIPGLGLLTLLVTITIFGVLASTVLAQPLIYWGNHILDSAPIIKTIYSSIKDLITAFVGNQKRFDQPVLVKMYENATVQKLGFMTSDDLSDLGIMKGQVAVYLPHSYAFSGNLFIVPAENVTLIDASASDIMKFIVSGGVSKIGDNRE